MAQAFVSNVQLDVVGQLVTESEVNKVRVRSWFCVLRISVHHHPIKEILLRDRVFAGKFFVMSLGARGVCRDAYIHPQYLLARGHKQGQDLQGIRPYLNNSEQESYRIWLGSSRKNSACELLDQCWEGGLENWARN